MANNLQKTALKLEKVTKVYPNGIVANNQVDLEVHYGEIHALFGENGSGKTTLVKNILGENVITSGTIRVDQEMLATHSPEKAKQLGIAAVRQHFALIDNFSIFENVILGCERKTQSALLKIEKKYQKKLSQLQAQKTANSTEETTKKYANDLNRLKAWKEKESATLLCYQQGLKEEVSNLIEKFKLGLKPEVIVDELSVNKKQKVEILKILFRSVKIVIFDEPTSLISVSEIKQLLELLLMYKKLGKAVIFISHKVEEIRQIADWVTILRKGKVVGSFAIDKVSNDQLVSLMVGNQKLSDLATLKRKPIKDSTILEINNLSLKTAQKWVLNEVDFKLQGGEIVGIAGVEENGQKELLEAIARVGSRCKGRMLYKQGVDLQKLSPIEVKKQKIAYVPQDRQKQSLVLGENLIFNTFFDHWSSEEFFRFGLVNWKKITETTKTIIDRYQVQGVSALTQIAANLSGGNQQKFVIGRELESEPQLFLLHEPMWGIDVKTINYLSKLLIDFRNRGNSVLFASSELNDLLTLSDRVLVISKGHIMGEVNPRSANASQAIGKLMTKAVV